ncbi:MAG TPA: DMT family transporter [Flavipsychrobacter sp.]|nr:DMT family transporter [Flavipsychrobacter sp.]
MSTNNNILYFALALITGALIPVQAATNAAFSKSIGNPIATGLMVFIIGLIGMLLFSFFSKTPLPTLQGLKQAPAYGYIGGLIVAIYVIMITILTPRIGVGASIGLIITGQLLCAVAIDHFGLFNVAVRHITISRFIGMLLMIAGIYLVMKKKTVS